MMTMRVTKTNGLSLEEMANMIVATNLAAQLQADQKLARIVRFIEPTTIKSMYQFGMDLAAFEKSYVAPGVADYSYIIKYIPEQYRCVLNDENKEQLEMIEKSYDQYIRDSIGDIMDIDKRAMRLINTIIELKGSIKSVPVISFVESYVSPGNAKYSILKEYINKLN